MANAPAPKKNWTLRILLLILSVCLGVWVLVSVFHAFRSTPDQIKLVNYDEYVAKALDFVKQEDI